VVANRGQSIAVRYDEKGEHERQIVWHTNLQEGCILTKLVRMTEGANEAYQLKIQRTRKECVLLTDDGECECAWCFTKGWPEEVEEMGAAGMNEDQCWELRNMDPMEGRAQALRYLRDRDCAALSGQECGCTWCVRRGWPA